MGIFVGLPQTELDALRASAIAAATGGQRTALSGGQKSGSKQYPFSPQEILGEVKYAEQQNGTRRPRAQRVEQVLVRPFSEEPLGDGFPLG